jgi:exodeoxyribonuclease VII large subunit
MAEWLASLPLSITFMPPVCPLHQLPMRLIGSGRKFGWQCRDELCSIKAAFSGDIPQCPIHRQTLHLRGSGTQKMLVCPSAKKERCPVQVAVVVETIFPGPQAPPPLHADGALALQNRSADGVIQQRLEGLGDQLLPLRLTTKMRRKIGSGEANGQNATATSAPSATVNKNAFLPASQDSSQTKESEDNEDEVAEWLRPRKKEQEGKSTYTVSEITRLIQNTFSEHPVLGRSIVVEGELSNVKRSSRGHVYFTLKDGDASIGGILWAGVASRLNFELADGMAVYLTGKLEVYGRSGTYSLVASKLEPVGIGALQLAFQQIKARLEAEGLFMEDFKQALPDCPQRIGIITSSTGAVIHDMLRVIRRKNRFMDVLLHPVKVQGEGAAEDIAAAIAELNQPEYELDALIVARGGGSFEDLFCFSEETIVRAIFNSHVPIVTGIGHEPDFSLADAAADYSASTPTAAADWLTPDAEQMVELLNNRLRELMQGMLAHLQYYDRNLDDDTTRLLEQHERLIDNARLHLQRLREQLLAQADGYFLRKVERVASLASNLNAFNPLETLTRGYAVATAAAFPDEKKNPPLLHSIAQIKEGEELYLRLSDGRLRARVLSREALPDTESKLITSLPNPNLETSI